MEAVELDLTDGPRIDEALWRLHQRLDGGAAQPPGPHLDTLSEMVTTSTPEGVLSTLAAAGRLAGDGGDYHSPRNNLIGWVVASGHGQPILLSAVAIAVAQRCGVGLWGVGLPGHFVVGAPARSEGAPPRLFDPFNGGRPMSPHDVLGLMRRATGRDQPPRRAVLKPASVEQACARVLANLARDLRAAGRRGDAHDAHEMRARLPGVGRRALVEAVQRLASDGSIERAIALATDLGDDALIARLTVARRASTN